MGPHLAKELRQRLPNPDKGIGSVMTSGQMATADRAMQCGIMESDTCCFLRGELTELEALALRM